MKRFLHQYARPTAASKEPGVWHWQCLWQPGKDDFCFDSQPAEKIDVGADVDMYLNDPSTDVDICTNFLLFRIHFEMQHRAANDRAAAAALKTQFSQDGVKYETVLLDCK